MSVCIRSSNEGETIKAKKEIKMNDLKKFALQVSEMRRLQRKYFITRDKTTLYLAKREERAIDLACADIAADAYSEQQKMEI